MDDKTIDKHESYGLIGISRQTSSLAVPLFGSSIKHNNIISICIRHAKVERKYHQEWFFSDSRQPIVEINLSPSQFAEMITTMNIGDGVPCTIRYVEGKEMERPPYSGMNETFNKELVQDVDHCLTELKELEKQATELLEKKGQLKVSERKELLDRLKMLIQHIFSNMPFLHKQYTRAMNKTVTTAKAEIEAFYTNAVIKVGKNALENGDSLDIPKLTDNKRKALPIGRKLK
jgi:ElaB/YqjD/DUF883 family membrane-anchored ribosome-binding protein